MTNEHDWLEIRLETTDCFDSDTLEEALFAAGALSVTLVSKCDEIILVEPTPGDIPLWESGVVVTGLFDKGFVIDQALTILKSCLQTEDLPSISITTLADRQWETEWKKHFKPMQYGENLWVCPSEQEIPSEHVTSKTQIITLDPGLAFGTGTHSTTAMVLTYLSTVEITDYSVIDYGCGSGILGIAAIKMNAKSATMTDIDPQALAIAKQNAIINKTDTAMAYYPPESVPKQSVDLLIANILLEPLLQLKDTFIDLCHCKTTVLLTGLLPQQANDIIDSYTTDFSDFDVTYSGDWAMVVCRRKTI